MTLLRGGGGVKGTIIAMSYLKKPPLVVLAGVSFGSSDRSLTIADTSYSDESGISRKAEFRRNRTPFTKIQ